MSLDVLKSLTATWRFNRWMLEIDMSGTVTNATLIGRSHRRWYSRTREPIMPCDLEASILFPRNIDKPGTLTAVVPADMPPRNRSPGRHRSAWKSADNRDK
jgi:hypothetical protein